MSVVRNRAKAKLELISTAMESGYEDLFGSDFGGLTGGEGSPPPGGQCPRSQANARERFRTHSVNSAFNNLRQLIPTEPKNRKLSKIETLRLAKSYISHLIAVLITGNLRQPCLQSSQHQTTESVDFNESGTSSDGDCGFGSMKSVVTDCESMACGNETPIGGTMRPSICTFCISSKK